MTFVCKWLRLALLTTALMQRLSKQLRDLEIPFVDDFLEAEQSADHIVDAIFGMYCYVRIDNCSRLTCEKASASLEKSVSPSLL